MHYQHREDALSQAQEELLEVLLQSDEDCYPWYPAEPEAQAYFAQLEAQFSLDHCQQEEEIAADSHALFNRLHQCFSSLVSSATETLNLSLSQRFSAIVPQTWLEAIAHQAKQVFQTNLSSAEQLVLCVKPLLPNWTEDDLLLLARPWAYAMRGTSDITVPGKTGLGQPSDWTELSPVEQVRLSLAVAHSALAHLENSSSDT